MVRRGTSVRIWSIPFSPIYLPWLLLPLTFLLGGMAGHLMAGAASEQLGQWLEGYSVSCLTQGSVQMNLPGSLWRCLEPILLAGILSFSALGVLGLPVLLALQGFRTGYAISGLARAWGMPGLETAALWVGVEDFILLALLLAISIPGWSRAWELATQTRLGRRVPPGYRQRCGLFCLGGLALLLLYEWIVCSYITPVLWTNLL